jgi:DivIVA domain-containing protein
MPTSDLDMPLLPSSEQIRRREFATIRRGYDPQQVRMYLESIADQVQTLERELNELRMGSDASAARGPVSAPTPADADPYESLSRRFASLIEVADQEAARTIGDARVDAARMLDEARAEADRVRVDAQAHAEEARQEGADLLERARLESERTLAGLAERRRELVTSLEDMRAMLIAAADELGEPLEQARREAEAPSADEPSAEEAPSELAGVLETAETPQPTYEELWISTDGIALPDLASIDLEFDDPD